MDIIDNAISPSLFNLIKEDVESAGFPWFFLKEASGATKGSRDNLDYSFFHLALSHDNISDFYDMSMAVALLLKDKFSMDEKYAVNRLRWGMTTKVSQAWRNKPHTDVNENHMVILFYLTDTDGDTYFYDKNHKIIDSVSPKANRAVLFDGLCLHSSSKPTKSDRRIVLNINLKEK